MTTQTEAERLAEWLERRQMMMLQDRQAAAELRRLHEVNQELLDEVARLKALAEQPAPTGKTMYWDADDPESGPSHDIESLLNNVASNGDLEVGAEVHIVRALELPDMRVRVTKVPEDEDIEYEVITKGGAA
jgi:hypothetical protein